ncbi:MAG: cobyrinate a,c-diamide synthase, partial [Pseudomonadota bacterium]
LFDGAADDTGSAADLAALLGLPILLVIDASRMGQSISALVAGFASHRADISIAGIILNRVGSERHRTMLERALAPLQIPILGVVPLQAALSLPSRHLGLVLADEHNALESFITQAAAVVTAHCDLQRIASLGFERPQGVPTDPLPPLGQHIAIARDDAFSFVYPHLLDGWRTQGASISFFSPLADEAPVSDADAIFLPGGYPELHAEKLSAAHHFRDRMQAAALADVLIYGECGGYMVLGDGLIDGNGRAHAMLGLLPVTTSFAKRTRHLGYRQLTSSALPGWTFNLRGHEFHYSSLEAMQKTEPLFHASDAAGTALGPVGQIVGRVMGSYMHVIDRVA